MHCGFSSHIYKLFNIDPLESFKDRGPEFSPLGCLGVQIQVRERAPDSSSPGEDNVIYRRLQQRKAAADFCAVLHLQSATALLSLWESFLEKAVTPGEEAR